MISTDEFAFPGVIDLESRVTLNPSPGTLALNWRKSPVPSVPANALTIGSVALILAAKSCKN